LPDVTQIWVPVGDTVLIHGIASAAKHLRPEVRVVGIQAECASAYYLSWKRGSAVSTDTCDTIADGLATRTPIEDNVAAIRELVDDVRLVTEDQMLRAIDLLVKEHVVAEPAGAPLGWPILLLRLEGQSCCSSPVRILPKRFCVEL